MNTLKTKVNNLDQKIPDVTTLIHINQYNTVKQNVEKKSLDVDKKVDTSGLVTATVLNTKISEADNRISDNSKYITIQEFNKFTAENFCSKIKTS